MCGCVSNTDGPIAEVVDTGAGFLAKEKKKLTITKTPNARQRVNDREREREKSVIGKRKSKKPNWHAITHSVL